MQNMQKKYAKTIRNEAVFHMQNSDMCTKKCLLQVSAVGDEGLSFFFWHILHVLHAYALPIGTLLMLNIQSSAKINVPVRT